MKKNEDYQKIYKEVMENETFRKFFDQTPENEKKIVLEALNHYITLLSEQFIPSYNNIINSYIDSKKQK